MNSQYWKQKDGSFLLEREAFKLAEIYYKTYSKYSGKFIRASQIKKSKSWPAFLKTIEQRGSQPEWDAYRFIEIQFNEYGKIYPYHLYSKDAWKTYIDRYQVGFEDRDKTIALSLLNAYKVIQAWCKRKKIEGVDVRAYFTNPLNILLLENKKLSPYFLSICKSFKDHYCELNISEQYAIIKPSQLESARRAVFSNKKILKKMKELLGNEFDGGTI